MAVNPCCYNSPGKSTIDHDDAGQAADRLVACCIRKDHWKRQGAGSFFWPNAGVRLFAPMNETQLADCPGVVESLIARRDFLGDETKEWCRRPDRLFSGAGIQGA